MGKAYLSSYSPSADETVEPGTTVYPEMSVKATQEINAYIRILYRDDYGVEQLCGERDNVTIGYYDTVPFACSFVMPSKTRTVIFVGFHAEGGVWVEDFREEVTLTPTAVPEPVSKFEFNQPPYIEYGGVWYQPPATITNIPAGARLKAAAWVKEVNGKAGTAYLLAKTVYDVKMCRIKKYIPAYGVEFIECTFDMPSKSESIKIDCGEDRYPYDVQDSDCCIELELEPVPGEPKFEFVDASCYLKWDSNKCYKDQTKDVEIGSQVNVVAKVKNTGAGSGKPTIKILHGVTKLCEDSFTSDIAPNESGILQFSCFVMPDANRDIIMEVYSSGKLDNVVKHFRLRPVSPPPTLATINFSTSPPDAITTLNGSPLIKETPYSTLVIAGSYTVVYSLVGYEDCTLTRTLQAGDVWDAHCSLVPVTPPLPECEKGVVIEVSDVPVEGLHVKCWMGECTGLPAFTEEVSTSEPTVAFSNILPFICWGTKEYCFQVENMSGDVMSKLEGITVPCDFEGCKGPFKMYGYLGRKYRTRITASPAYPAPGKSFTLEARLTINPDERASEGMRVEFFKVSGTYDAVSNTWGTEDPIDANVTNEDGIAFLSHTEPDKGTYKYIARYIYGATYAEVKTVSVREPLVVPPCPIACICMDTPLVDALGPLRVFRDKVLKKFGPGRWFVSFYYDRLTPWLSPKILKIRGKHW